MKKIILFFYCCIVVVNADAQLTRYSIGDSNNQVATKVCYLSRDKSAIIAGYSYDYSGGDASNCQAILMKVYYSSGGFIQWQKTFGMPGTNNLIKDMIITQDGNIVVVGKVLGTGGVFDDNTAAILKFNSNDGSLMWQKCFRDSNTTSGGEIFFGVTELTDGTGRLVAVGDHNYSDYSVGMVCVFQSDGTLIYDETDNLASVQDFCGITTAADGSSVFICGQSYGSCHCGNVLSYTPGTISGSVNWANGYDFSLYGTLGYNFFLNIFLSDTQLIITGQSWDGSISSIGHSILTVKASDGSNPNLYGIQNSGLNFSNNPAIAVKSVDHIFTVQSPNSVEQGNYLAPGITTNTVINEITSVSSHTYNTPVKFISALVGEHSFSDMKLEPGGNRLFLAGATNVTSGFGGTDVYFVVSGTSFSSTNLNCDTTHDILSIANQTLSVNSPTAIVSNFIPAYSSVDTGTTHYGILMLCGDTVIDTVTTTGLMYVEKQDVSLFPNPAANTLTIKTTNTPYTSFTITNMVGQPMTQQAINTNETSVNIAALPAGVYFVTFKGEKGDVVRRFLKM